MMRVCSFSALAGFLILLSSGCHKTESLNPLAPIDTSDGGPIVRKPNIYIYPKTTQTMDVTLSFPHGGRLLDAVPAYGLGWHITVNANGTIDDKYRYLFYEAQTPDAYQYNAGWFVARDTLGRFFPQILSKAGFVESEIADFVEYWIPLLNKSDHYLIFPQLKPQIDQVIVVDISPLPEQFLRLFFVVSPAGTVPQGLLLPEISSFERSGYCAAEWAVVLK